VRRKGRVRPGAEGRPRKVSAKNATEKKKEYGGDIKEAPRSKALKSKTPNKIGHGLL